MGRDRVKRIAEAYGWKKPPGGRWESPCGEDSANDVDVLLKILEYTKRKTKEKEKP